MSVYLIRYEKPAGDPNRPGCHASYYIGYADDVEARLEAHRKGQSGAALPTWFAQQGIDFELVQVWKGKDRNFERRLKKAGHYYRHDPSHPKCLKKYRTNGQS